VQRGDIVLVDLEPARGTEADKTRPAVVVSNDASNASAVRQRRGVVTVVPVTSNIERIYPFQVMLSHSDTGLHADSKAQAEQVRSVDVRRVGRTIGAVPADLMGPLDDALRLHLAL
jgi:mRNA interferase MazF